MQCVIQVKIKRRSEFSFFLRAFLFSLNKSPELLPSWFNPVLPWIPHYIYDSGTTKRLVWCFELFYVPVIL